MKTFRYLPNVSTLQLDYEACIGCGMCMQVCPHTVFSLEKRRASIIDIDGCMECGACMTNCPVSAISVNPGVGCAAYIVQKWLQGTRLAGFCDNKCC